MASEYETRDNPKSGGDSIDGRDLLVGRPEGAEVNKHAPNPSWHFSRQPSSIEPISFH